MSCYLIIAIKDMKHNVGLSYIYPSCCYIWTLLYFFIFPISRTKVTFNRTQNHHNRCPVPFQFPGKENGKKGVGMVEVT